MKRSIFNFMILVSAPSTFLATAFTPVVQAQLPEELNFPDRIHGGTIISVERSAITVSSPARTSIIEDFYPNGTLKSRTPMFYPQENPRVFVLSDSLLNGKSGSADNVYTYRVSDLKVGGCRKCRSQSQERCPHCEIL